MLLALLLLSHQGAPLELRELEESLARRPSDAKLYVERAEFLRTVGRFEAALSDLDVASALGLEAPLLRARIHVMRGELDVAERLLDRVAPSVESHFLRGGIRVSLGRLAEAHADFEEAVRRGGGVEVQLAKVRVERRLGAVDVASLVRAVDRHGAAVLVRELAAVAPKDVSLPRIDEVLAKARVKTDWLLLRAEVFERSGESEAARRDREAALLEARRLLKKRPSRASRAALARAEGALR